METPEVTPLAPATPHHHSVTSSPKLPLHPKLSQCRLRHRSCFGIMRGRSCEVDHALLCRVRFQPRKIHRAKPVGRPCINTAKTADPPQKEKFLAALEQALQDPQGQDATSRWNFIRREAVYKASMLGFGKKERPSQDWFNAFITDMDPVIEAVVDRSSYAPDFQFPLRINVKISEHAPNFNVFKPRLVCRRILILPSSSSGNSQKSEILKNLKFSKI